ncbi:glycosyltransferase family 4 protein [Thiohalocapsa marina]|uniref:Glycosyltransferase family 4 protein n=1 Tax=Thiohalocapsa marina TaxID=424902 RepID=A0A5M8FVR0_9GAMM|nr:glycosyltransferase [Thiohalocapsa marina]KAA6187865.1 glycosyltransferase family 4 protein [Thiohalocapsa marina]
MNIRILLFAYEFPPVLAAQALRWYYLSNELARLGAELDVLSPSIPNLWGFEPTLEASVQVHRCFAGPFVGLSSFGARRFRSQGSPNPEIAAASPSGPSPPTPVERAYRWARGILDQVVFPDVRTEWLPFAWHAARRLHAKRRYDLIISSHEPGVDLLLGLRAQRAWGLPWLVDLADPLVAPYTPKWRMRLDVRLERQVCQRADRLLVTTEAVARTLAARHNLPPNRFTWIRQGFDQRWRPAPDYELPEDWPKGRFVVLFTGTFYPGFRAPDAFIQALSALKDVHLVLVGDMGPFAAAFRAIGNRVTLLGKQPHDTCLELQRRADVLINLGNRGDDQVPGKIYEYLGAGRPVLHIATNASDPVPRLLSHLRRGIAVPNESGRIAQALVELQDQWSTDTLDAAFDLGVERVKAFSWQSQAIRLHKLLCELCRREGAAFSDRNSL